MVLVGIVLIVLAVVGGLVAAAGSTPGAQIDVANFHVTAASGVIFFTGAAAGFLLLAGLWLVLRGLRRGRARRREIRELRRAADSQPGQVAGSGSTSTPTPTDRTGRSDGTT